MSSPHTALPRKNTGVQVYARPKPSYFPLTSKLPTPHPTAMHPRALSLETESAKKPEIREPAAALRGNTKEYWLNKPKALRPNWKPHQKENTQVLRMRALYLVLCIIKTSWP